MSSHLAAHLALIASMVFAGTSSPAGEPDWIRRAGPPMPIDAAGNGITAIVFSDDGKQLLVETEQPALHVLDAGSGKPLRGALAGYRADAGVAMPSGAGTRVLVASATGLTTIDAGATSTRRLAGLKQEPSRIAVSANGARVALAYADDKVQVFDAATGKSLFGPAKVVLAKPVMGTALDHVTALALSADGTRLVVAGEDASVRVVDAATGKALFELDHGAYQGVSFVHGAAQQIVLTRDGKRIVTFEKGGNLGLHDAVTGKPLGALVQVRGRITALAISADGRSAFSGDADGNLAALGARRAIAEASAVDDARRHMPRRHMAGGVLDVSGLVVEEKVGLELAQELAFAQAAEEHRLVDLDVPLHQACGSPARAPARCAP